MMTPFSLPYRPSEVVFEAPVNVSINPPESPLLSLAIAALPFLVPYLLRRNKKR
jgi:hypothetical protein